MSKALQKAETLTVDGIEYSWEYSHGWGVDWGIGLRGASVSVCLQSTSRTRELIVDFPFSAFGVKTPKKSVLIRHLEAAIRAAISAGWEPESRGKQFRFNVPDAA